MQTSETSSVGLHSWTATQEEKQQLRMHGQVWKQGLWDVDETEQLKRNIIDYCEVCSIWLLLFALQNNIYFYIQSFSIKNPCEIIFESGKEKRKNFYKTIAKGINRPLFAIYRRVVR